MLIKELQSLALDVKVLSDTREEIIIGEDDDDDIAPLDLNISGFEDVPPIEPAAEAESAEAFDEFDEFDDFGDDFAAVPDGEALESFDEEESLDIDVDLGDDLN